MTRLNVLGIDFPVSFSKYPKLIHLNRDAEKHANFLIVSVVIITVVELIEYRIGD